MEEKMTPNLEVVLGSLRMKNPVTTASGTFGYGQEYDRYYDVAQLGAVTTKSISLTPRSGNKPPRLVETPAGLLNAIGLQNVGLEAYLREKAPYLRSKGATIITNIYGHSLEEYAELAARIESEGAGDAIEANLSCPNVHDARTATGAQLISQVPELVAEYTRAIRAATRLPLIIKLSPNVVDIKEPALAAEQAGADAVSLINTLIGMAIDPETRRPRLANIVGGLSGPAIRPVALKMVWEVAKVLSIPIVGMGGICTT
ncbi:MAG TPA: dihydroorotate dehydrogenase, partial [Gammaproteobacteria bacterium]|nr:dihydroorotate dehydrogenase [Gammaproteobacteria bacterium]